MLKIELFRITRYGCEILHIVHFSIPFFQHCCKGTRTSRIKTPASSTFDTICSSMTLLTAKKYVVTPMKLCRIGFDLFKDSDLEDLRNLIPLDNESSSSDDEVLDDKDKSSMDVLGPCSGDKHKFASRKQKRKKKNQAANCPSLLTV